MSLQKPGGVTAISGSHPLAANITAFWEFGATDSDLVSETSLTTTAALVDDADIGLCRNFTASADVVGQTLSISGNNTVLLIYKNTGSGTAGGQSLTVPLDVASSGDIIKLRQGGYSAYDYRWDLRAGGGTETRTSYQPYMANQEAYEGAKASAWTVDLFNTPQMWQNGAQVTATDVQDPQGEDFAASPKAVTVMGQVEDEGSMLLGAIVVFDKLLSASEMESVTNDPWAMVDTGASISITGDLQPGANFTVNYANFEGVPVSPVTLTDSNSNSITVPVTISDNGDGTGTATGTMPALPTSGTAQGLLFGNVTVELST